ncbi:MAG: hypothetical protein M3094_02760, partial [Actinomycetia bacterium]|nr:hypothetical protein [Actinomycetes bacterium]
MTSSSDNDVVITGDIAARRSILVEARGGFDHNADAYARSGGLGSNSDANDGSRGTGRNVGNGVVISGSTIATLGNGGSLTAEFVFINAMAGVEHELNNSGVVVNAVAPIVTGYRAVSDSYAKASALGADSDATARVLVNDQTDVRLLTGSSIVADRVLLSSRHENVYLLAEADAKCSCEGGDTDATAVVDYISSSEVTGLNNSYIETTYLIVDTNQSGSNGFAAPRLIRDADKSGGFLGDGDERTKGSSSSKRFIFFESTVKLLGEPNPVLTVSAGGEIIEKTTNVYVKSFNPTSRTFSGLLEIGDSIDPSHWIVVGDLLYDETGFVRFQANGLSDAPASIISGNSAEFLIKNTWDDVNITNYSLSKLVVNEINVVSAAADPNIEVSIDIIPGPLNSPANDVSIAEHIQTLFEFKIVNEFIKTQVFVGNLFPVATTSGSPDLVLDGPIENPIGRTTILNERGSIFSDAGSRSPLTCTPGALDCGLGIEGNGVLPHADGDPIVSSFTTEGSDNDIELIRTNILDIDAPNGAIGRRADTGTRVPITVELIRFLDETATLFLFDLEAAAGDDVVLDITANRRSGEAIGTAFIAQIDKVHAGNDVDLVLHDSIEGRDLDNRFGVFVELFNPDEAPPQTA